jgi:endonuclease-3
MKNSYISIVEALKKAYPEATCSLNFETPFQLCIAVMLSAQCTDERVNKVTPALFKAMPNPEAFAKANLSDIENLIHSCGFYKNKAKNAKECAITLIEKYSGTVPHSMEELMTLPGIGRKSANVIMLEAFNEPCGVAVDTHAKRICNRIGISQQSDPIKIEQDIVALFPKKYLKDINHLFVWHGRNCCIARSPQCKICPINRYCKYYNTLFS